MKETYELVVCVCMCEEYIMRTSTDYAHTLCVCDLCNIDQSE